MARAIGTGAQPRISETEAGAAEGANAYATEAPEPSSRLQIGVREMIRREPIRLVHYSEILKVSDPRGIQADTNDCRRPWHGAQLTPCSEEDRMSEGKFKEELSQIPYGVSVVTVGFGSTSNGLAVSWLSQVSFDPPMLMFAIDKLHFSTELVEDMPSFVVNLLAHDQVEMAGHFAKRSMADEQKLDAYETQETEAGQIILSDALAYYACDVVAKHEAGSHFIVIGEVTESAVLREGAPLTTAQGLRYTK
jgi:flavin reductase (DIM6/NTAB) family NADH-FMN oxidoreductase RutF